MKRIISLFLVLASFIGLTTTYAEPAPIETHKIYVSAVSGNDDNEGTIDKPLKTIAAAKERVKKINKSEKKVEVIFRGGEYRVSKTLEFDSSDSGTKENPVVYKAYEGEKVYVKASLPLDISKAKRVTDPAILDRLYDDVETRIIELDLAEQGIDKSMLWKPQNIKGQYQMTEGPAMYNAIYFDNSEQMLACWPNDREYDYWDKTLTTSSFTVTTDNIKRWERAENTWIGIFPLHDYNFSNKSVTEIDAENKTIHVLADSANPIRGYRSKRWKIFNLMEEIDIPGEYYIDYDTEKLYFFPPDTITGKTLEISLLGTPIMNFFEADNITFKDIEFCQTRSSVAVLTDVDNIDFYNCIFRDIGYDAICTKATQKAVTGASTWQAQTKNGAYNMDIIGCFFENIGDRAVITNGAGDIDTLTPANIVIEDCYITRTAQKAFWDAIWMYGCGVTVRNCIISNIPHQAIRLYGVDLTVEYNDIHNVIREDDDAAAIYGGQNELFRNWQVNYNYIHDIISIQKMSYNATLGLYFDDGQLGNTGKHNIFRNMRIGYNSNQAADTHVQYNIFIDVIKPISTHGADRLSGDKVTQYHLHATLEDLHNDIADPELYFERFPNLKEVVLKGTNPLKFTKYSDNLMVDCGESVFEPQYVQYGDMTNNVSIQGKDIFVNPEKQDYRLKADSDMAIANPNLLNENNFDIEKIGLKRNDLVFNEETAPFELHYPVYNQEAVDSREVKFVWSKATTATQYKLIVAEDPEFKNVVLDELVYNSAKTISSLQKNKTYYWKVIAINNSRQFQNQWENIGGYGKFTTALYEFPDATQLINALDEVSANLDNMVESDVAGEYRMGTKKKITSYLDLLRFITTKAIKALTSYEQIDYYTNEVLSLYKSKENLNPGFLDMKKYIKKDLWLGATDIVDGESVTVFNEAGGTIMGGLDEAKRTSGNVIYCFDFAIEGLETSFLCVGSNMNVQQQAWSGGNMGYMLCIKKDLVELQKMDGSSNKIVAVKEGTNLCDGKPHSYRFGRIDMGYANVIYCEIDGEVIFEYPDVSGTEIVVDGGITLQTMRMGAKMTMTPSANVPTDLESFEKVKERLTKASAKALQNEYNADFTNARVINPESDRVLTATGLYKTDLMPYAVGNTEVNASVDTVEKIFNQKGTVSGGNYTISVDGKTATLPITIKDGINTVSLEKLCEKLGKVYMYDVTYSGNIVVADDGGQNPQNIGTMQKKVMGLLKAAMSYGEFEF